MTRIDGTDTGFRTRIDADTTAMVDTIAALGGDGSRTAALHRIVAEHHAGLMRASGRSADELARLAKNSTAAEPSPAGAVDGGQGATRPPAPTIAPKVLEPIGSGCPVTPCCTVARHRPPHHARWWVGDTGHACCDHHIPDGWVRPGNVIATTLPPACANCGERSEHEVCP